MSTPKSRRTLTTGGTWARIISECLKDAGVEPRAIFEKAGLDFDIATAPDSRVSDTRLRAIYPLCAEATNIEIFGLHLGKYVKAHTFHALGLAIMASSTISDALQRFARHSAILTDSGHVEIIDAGDTVRFEVSLYKDEQGQCYIPDLALDAFFFGLINLLRDIIDDASFSAIAVQRKRSAPHNPLPFREAMGCVINYECNGDALVFRRQDIERPVRYGNESLARIQDDITAKFIAKMSPEFGDRIYRVIINELPNGELSAEKLAGKMNMSLRKLQGRLQQANTSYQQLLDKARRELACKYLRDTRYTLTEITFLLGFANSAGFSRAFKRWFDLSPSEYRRQR